MKKKFINNEDLFFCYSLRLFMFIRSNSNPQIRYLDKELNPNTNRYYWTFERTPQLKELLDAFNKEKQEFLRSK